jgi:metal-responsive CopG/Arc/MetJ family transcriptional regulator
MTTIKTAVSLEQNLFKQVEEVAGEMQVSRSRFFALAIEAYIERYETQKLVMALNEAYAHGLTQEEQQDMQAMQSLETELWEDEGW